MKKILFTLAIMAWAAPVFAWSLAIDPPSLGSQTPTFYYFTGLPAGTAATYTAALPPFFTATGGVAATPDSTGATGCTLPLPSAWVPGSTILSGTVIACDGVGCTAATPFGPPSSPANARLVNK